MHQINLPISVQVCLDAVGMAGFGHRTPSTGLAARAQEQVAAAHRHTLDHAGALVTTEPVAAEHVKSPLAERPALMSQPAFERGHDRHTAGTVRTPRDAYRLSRQPPEFIGFEVRRAPRRVDTGDKQDFRAEVISETCNKRLVDEQ